MIGLKRAAALILASVSVLALAGCGNKAQFMDGIDVPSGSTELSVHASEGTTPTGFSAEDSFVPEPVSFVWEEVGFGGDFIVTLEPYNTFRICEGPLSSTVYRGYFSVDGDVITLRDSATSDGHKDFRFRINDDRTELTYIEEGSENFPFCELTDGALFSTRFHHDESEYFEKAASKRKNGMDGTGEDKNDMAEGNSAGRSGNAAASTERSHSMEDPGIGRMDAGKLEGVTMSVTDVTDTSVTVVIRNSTDKEIMAGDDFWIVRQTDDGPERLEPIMDDYAFNAIGYIVKKDEPFVLEVEYGWLFGKLEPGRYGIVKKIDDFRGTGDFDTYEYCAYFTVWGDGYTIDYGESEIYGRQDMDEAIAVILDSFRTFEESGCVLHSIRYAGDSCSSWENLKWMNDLSRDGIVYTQCIGFLSDYHSPKEDAGAWNPDSEYEDWGWWLARTDGGPWTLMTEGY